MGSLTGLKEKKKSVYYRLKFLLYKKVYFIVKNEKTFQTNQQINHILIIIYYFLNQDTFKWRLTSFIVIKQIVIHFSCNEFVHGLSSLIHHSQQELFKSFLVVQSIWKKMSFAYLHWPDCVVLWCKLTSSRLIEEEEMWRHHRVKWGTHSRSKCIRCTRIEVDIISVVESVSVWFKIELSQNLST